jgi:hypothetical protein
MKGRKAPFFILSPIFVRPMKNVFKLFVFFIFHLLASHVVLASYERKVAVLDLTVRNSETGLSRIRSCRHILQTAGLPYVETMDVAEAIQYPVIVISPVIYSYTFTSSEKTWLTNYVNQGGILIASSLRDPELYPLFGVSGFTNYTNITSMTWDVQGYPDYFDRFDDPNEITISLRGESSSSETFTIRPYTIVGAAQNLATLNNGTNGLVMNTFGQGRTFLFAIDLRDVIIRNQINSDINAQRSYSNGFEPTSDAFIFFISNVITQHIPFIPRVHTCPDCESSVVMITHDIDSRTAMDSMSVFIDYEEQHDLHAMYNITTRIYDDEWMSDFYIGTYNQVHYAKLHGQKLASHSLGHFIDFADGNLFPLGTLGNTPSNYMPLYFDGVTSGGSVFGETEVSKYLLEQDHGVQVKSFRAGHLAYNKRLPKALTDLGYLYNSTFSANDVLTNFPFYTTDNLAFSGQQMPVLEIPMTISDAAGCCPFTQENALQRAALWAEVAIKNNNNGAPTVLLIHPNRGYKLPAQQLFVDAMPEDVKFMFLDDFGDYWKKRETANVVSEFRNDSLFVHFNGFELNSTLSLVVKDVDDLSGITFFDVNGQELFPESLNVSFNETRFCHFVYGPQVEVCNGIDDNGNGEVDENLGYTQYRDEDEDGYGDPELSVVACEMQWGYVEDNTDCDDQSTVIHPNNSEYCDELDNDCDGEIDEGLNWQLFFWDADGDGFGNDNVSISACVAPFNYVIQNGDCNDDLSGINPDQNEVCNDVDDNCEGNIDEGLAFAEYYEDADQDGFGNAAVVVTRCILPFGFVPQHGDCNDNHFTTNPNAIESCDDDEDNDCDGEINENCLLDGDEDGFNGDVDCNDVDNNIYPGANEICDNGVDDNCDGWDAECPVFGCTDPVALNYNPSANIDDGSCIQILFGCTDVTAFNYHPAANTDDGSCEAVVLGCTDPNAFNFSPAANTDDGSCVEVIFGCTDVAAFNYHPAANTDDGSCEAVVLGCTDPNAFNYSPAANTDDGSCVEVIFGCTDVTAFNYHPAANTDDGSCEEVVQGCLNMVACNFNPGANTDDGSCILPQPEICDEMDNDCDGWVNEDLMPADLNSTPVVTAVYPVCTTANLFSANLNNGANSAVIEGDGPDLWYRLTAQYNTLRVGLSAAAGDNSIQIYQDMNGCLMLVSEEHEITSGNQILLTDGLVTGETYYVAIHQNAAPTNPSAKVCFTHLLPSICDHAYSGNTGEYSSVCRSFKAEFRAQASQYIFNVLEMSQMGSNTSITPWNYTTPTASSILTRLGILLPANTTGSSQVYTLSIPALYQLLDAAGNMSILQANAINTCELILQPESGVSLRSSDRCPNVKAINQSIATDRSICGAQRYEWELTQVMPTAQAPITVLGGLNTNFLFLNTVPGMANGKTYNVRVRPIHSTGVVGEYGAAHCMKTTGAGMVMENHPGSAEPSHPSSLSQALVVGEMVSLFPNPTVDGQVTLLWNERQEGSKELILRDVQGRIVWNQKVVLEGNVLELDWKTLDTGIYLLEVDGQTLRVVKG